MNNNHILAANCQRPITEEEKRFYSTLKEVYEERVKNGAAKRSESYLLFTNNHLRHIKKVLDSGMIGSYKD